MKQIESVTSEQPQIAVALKVESSPTQQFPSEQYHQGWLLQGAKPGKASFVLRATFDDGSVREGTFEQDFAAVKSVGLGAECDLSKHAALYPAKSRIHVGLDMYDNQKRLLAGDLPGALAGEGFEEVRGTNTSGTWDSTLAADTTITSPLFPDLKQELHSYTPEQVSVDGIERSLSTGEQGKPQLFWRGILVPYEVRTSVDGKTPCEAPSLRIRITTPDVCTGQDNKLEWVGGLMLVPRESGTCSFEITPDGIERRQPYSVSYQLEPDFK